MFNYYLKRFARSILRSPLPFCLTTLSLWLGYAAALIIISFVSHELSFDNFHPEVSRLYRVGTIWNEGATSDDVRATSVAWAGPAARNLTQSMHDFVRVAPIDVFTGRNVVQYGDKAFSENNILIVDPSFLKVFGFKLVKGDLGSALTEPNSIVITSSIARKYFDQLDPIGKLLRIDDKDNISENTSDLYEVAGVIEDPPENTHLSFDFLLSFNLIFDGLHNGSTFWHWDYCYTYFLVADRTDASALAHRLTAEHKSTFGNELQNSGLTGPRFFLQPVSDIHLDASLQGDLHEGGNRDIILLLTVLGALIVCAALMNSLNSDSLEVLQKQPEIAVCAALGASMKEQWWQRCTTIFLVHLNAALLAVILFYCFSSLLDSSIAGTGHRIFNINGELLLSFLVVVSICVLLSALSSYMQLRRQASQRVIPRRNSKMNLSTGSTSTLFMVIQFSLCIALAVFSFTIVSQSTLTAHSDGKVNGDAVIAVSGFGFQRYSNFESFRNAIAHHPDVLSVGLATAIPGDQIAELSFNPTVAIESLGSSSRRVKLIHADDAYFKALQIPFVSGHSFAMESENQKVAIVNEAFVQLFGFSDPEKMIGEELSGLDAQKIKVIGVIKNYHQRSLREDFVPLVFMNARFHDYSWSKRYYLIRLRSEGKLMSSTVAKIQKVWNHVNPASPFTYFFLDDHIDLQYRNENRLGKMTRLFTIALVGVVLIGVVNMIAVVVGQRKTEIAVRRVHGATISQIAWLLLSTLLKSFLIASLISLPLIGFGIDHWLSQYVFRIPLSLELFLLPTFIILLLSVGIALIVIIGAGRANPAKALKGSE